MNIPDFKRLFIKKGHYIVASTVAIFIIGIGAIAGGGYMAYKAVETKFMLQFEKQEKHIDNLKAGISQDNIRRRNIIVSEQIIAKTNPKLKYDTRLEYATYIVDELERHPTVPLSLALAIGGCESGFNEDATTYLYVDGFKKSNAVGIYQIVPGTGQWIAGLMGIPYSDTARYDPRINIRMGIWYLNWLIDRYGNLEFVIAHYLNGNVGVESLSNRKAYAKSDEYNSLTRDEIVNELSKITLPDTGFVFIDQSSDKRYKALTEMLSAKEMPLQVVNGVPKYIQKMKMIDDFIKSSDIYLSTQSDSIKEN